jgi:hypothetical protein
MAREMRFLKSALFCALAGAAEKAQELKGFLRTTSARQKPSGT